MSTPTTLESSSLVAHDREENELKRKHVPRATQACQKCRQKKTKCDQGRPSCSICTGRSYQCVYSSVDTRTKRKTISEHDVRQGYWHLDPSSPAAPSQYIRKSPSAQQAPSHTIQADVSDSHASSMEKDGRLKKTDRPSNADKENAHESVAPSGGPRTESLRLDPVGGLNRHTRGTEFYGTSSNFALLGQLLSRTRPPIFLPSSVGVETPLHKDVTQKTSTFQQGRLGDANIASSLPPIDKENEGVHEVLKDNRVSIVNLLFDEEPVPQDSAMPSPRHTPDLPHWEGRANNTRQSPQSPTSQRGSGGLQQEFNFHADSYPSVAGVSSIPSNTDYSCEVSEIDQTRVQLEKEYLRIFFDNLHYIHPFLLPTIFVSRCEQEVWGAQGIAHMKEGQIHFFALYYVVIAVGALTAGTDLLFSLRQKLGKRNLVDTSEKEISVPTSVDLSKIYFRRAKKFLGDYFEVGSLESVQALILMSLYCQNALKPHACYMYSGMAVRTALAIGLPDESVGAAGAPSEDAKKTWWAIYSQEVDMCCSSGRRSSLLDLEEYPIPLPDTKSNGTITPVAMIPEMVHFASILLRISRQIYHQKKDVSVLEISHTALELDEQLTLWRSHLAPWLNFKSHPFKEPEWAGKQRLVLQLRYHNARILIHRPLMSSGALSTSELEVHTAACLDGARKTIELLYESYTHRHYFRTWYYNSTYTLYASMLVLYVVLTDSTRVPVDQLIHDVEKSLDILHAMENLKVAQRCAKLIGEVLQVAQVHVKTHQHVSFAERNSNCHVDNDEVDPIYRPESASNGADTMILPQHGSRDSHGHFAPPQTFDVSSGTAMRNDLLAGILNPVTLEGFASDIDLDQFLQPSNADLGAWMDFDPSYDFFSD